MMKRIALVLLALALLVVGSDAGAQETPRPGGVLKVATIGEPVGLGGGYARPGIRFWPDRRTPPSSA